MYAGDEEGGMSITGSGMLEGDQYDHLKMAPFVPVPAAAPAMAWWESLASYGVTRAIDNRFGPVNLGGNTSAGTFAGQNGRTYTNTTGAGAQPAGAAGIGGSTLLLIAAGVLAIALLR